MNRNTMAYKEDPEKKKARRKRHYDANRDEALAYSKSYREANKDAVNESTRKWREANPDKVKAQQSSYYAENSEHLKEYSRQYAKAHPEVARASDAKRANCPKRKAYKKEYSKNRNRELYANDPAFRVVNILRSRLNQGLARGKAGKVTNTLDLLGCSMDYFMKFIERKWQAGMSWSNHGRGKNKWHIDHREPCTSFDMNDEMGQRWCFHYSNLQPLWEPDNLKKSNKLNYTATALAKA